MLKIKTKLMMLALTGVLASTGLSAQTWNIGYSSMTFTDASRGNRQIPVNVFYPADVTGWNVPFGSPSDKRFPVVVFGHDEGTGFSNYQYMWDYLTYRGFIVVTPLTEMAVPMNVDEFAKDMAYIALEIKNMRYQAGSFFYQRHNSKSCLIGHGKGGSAALLGTQYYPGLTTMVTIAANETVPGVISAASSVTVPSVVVGGGNDCISPMGTVQEAIFNNISSDCKTLINFTTVPRCHFAQGAGTCTATQVSCGIVNPYSWQNVCHHTAYLLVSFMRYYMKSNEPALDKFEWKLRQKTQDFLYVYSCNMSDARVEWNPEDSEGEMDDDFNSFEVNLYPNPVRTGSDAMLEIETTKASKTDITITDMMGRVVSREMIELDALYNQVLVPTGNLRKGYYMISFTGNEGRISRPLIIN